MSSEACPFCGKTYKRLKSHLPHCKAAASATTKHDVTVTSSRRAHEPTLMTSQAAGAKVLVEPASRPPSSAKKKKPTAAATSKSPSPTAATSQSPSPTAATSQSPSPTAATSQSPSPTAATSQSPSPTAATSQSPSPTAATSQSPSPTAAKTPKKSLRALIEATKSQHVPEASLKAPASKNRTAAVADPLRSRTTPETKPDPGKANTKPTAKTKASKTKKAAQAPPPATEASGPLDSGPGLRDVFLLDNEGSSVVEMLKPGSRITLQDVKAALGRTKTSRQSSILSQIGSMDHLSPGPGSGLSLTPFQQPARPPSLVHPELVIPTSPAHPAPLLPEMILAPPPPHTLRLAEGVKVRRHLTGLPSSPLTPPVGAEPLGVCKQNASAVTQQQRLGQVRLRDLPEWLVCNAPRSPRDAVSAVQRGWQWYYRKYIDVKKGGVGGLSMLLAGYCVISYIWSFPHIKRDRWRKHH